MTLDEKRAEMLRRLELTRSLEKFLGTPPELAAATNLAIILTPEMPEEALDQALSVELPPELEELAKSLERSEVAPLQRRGEA